MAMGKGENAADTARREGAQPEVDPQAPDTTTGSPDAVRAATLAAARPSADRVAMVSRDVNGDPAQSQNFEVLVDDDAPDHIKDAHWNKAGELTGAKHYDPKKHGVEAERLDHDERARVENRELHRINFREELKA